MSQENLEQYCQKVAQHHSSLLIEDLENQETLWEDLNGHELEAVVGGATSVEIVGILANTVNIYSAVAATASLGEAVANTITTTINKLS